MSACARLFCALILGSSLGPLIAQDPIPLSSFGNNGTALIQNIGSTPDLYICDMAEDPQGRIIAMGHYDNGSTRRLFAQCFTVNGTLDASFGTGGRYFSPYDLGYVVGRTMVVRPDGRILLAGVSGISSPRGIEILQLLPDGTLDPEFGDNGVVGLAASADMISNTVEIAPDGSAYLAGTIDGWAFVVHLFESGELDTSFGDGGTAFPTPLEYQGVPADIMLAPSGYLVVSGCENAYPSSSGFMGALDLGGDPVTWFGEDGFVLINNSTTGLELPFHGEMAPDGSLLVGGIWNRSGHRNMFALRFLANGEMDNTFAESGILDIAVPQGIQRSVPFPHLLPDGTFLLCGGQSGPTGADAKLYAVRLNADGAIDDTFGTNGTYSYQRNNYAFADSRSSILRSNGDLAMISVLYHSGVTKNAVTVFDLDDLSTALPSSRAAEDKRLLFPNPTNGPITLRNWEMDALRPIELRDLQGRVVQRWSIPPTSGVGDVKLELSPALANGHYVIMTPTMDRSMRTALELVR
ncbi:MAG: hypothetical protein KA817_10965 [Flavobacteriales bacterium]|nr:hypothetical protein [Flavobacteriales bacterium]